MQSINIIKAGFYALLFSTLVACGGNMDGDVLVNNSNDSFSQAPSNATASPIPVIVVPPPNNSLPPVTPTFTPSTTPLVTPIPVATPIPIATPIPTATPTVPQVTVTPIVEPSLPESVNGESVYAEQCMACHGENGDGNFPLDRSNKDVTSLANTIESSMPFGNAGNCVGGCAHAVAEYLVALFNTAEPIETPSPTATPSTTPEEPNEPSEPELPSTQCNFPAWQSGNRYVDGDAVTRNGVFYTCLVGPWCASPADWAYAPGSGLYWQEAWTLNNSCEVEETPQVTPLATPLVTPQATPTSTPVTTITPTATPTATPTTAPTPTPAPQDTSALFNTHCSTCHNAQGLGGDLFTSSKQVAWENKSLAELEQKVSTMPVQQCDDQCIASISTYIWEERWGFTIAEIVAPGSGVRGVRLLSPFEYKNSVRDILNVSLNADELPEARFTGEFKYPTQAKTGRILVDNAREYQQLAESIVNRIDLSSIGCGTSTCTDTEFNSIAEKLFRRPLSNAEQTRYLAIKNNHSVRDALQSLLMSPLFLYRLEIGEWDEQTQRYVLNDYEIASLLAFSLWGTSPDANLLNAAANVQLSSVENIQARVHNMINDARFIENFTHFIQYYSNTYGDTFEKVSLSESVISAMKQEQTKAMEALFNQGGGSFDALFNPGFTFVNNELASHYGFVGSFSNDMTQVQTDRNRGGILHQGLTHIVNSDFSATSLVRRGKMIRENMLCHIMGVPSGIDPATIELPTTPITTRERWDVITGANASEGQCWECHKLMNEPGSALENFDQTGKFRTQEIAYNVAGVILDIDAHGELRSNNGFDTIAHYQDARDLAEDIAQSDIARACFVDNIYRFMSGHDVDAHVEAGIELIQEDFIIDGDIASMITKILISDFALQRENRN